MLPHQYDEQRKLLSLISSYSGEKLNVSVAVRHKFFMLLILTLASMFDVFFHQSSRELRERAVFMQFK
jgi:hypothetical protein